MTNHAFAMVFACLTLAVSAATGNEQVKTMIPKQPSGLEVSPLAAPFKNHWDSNSWENNSGDNFWHATAKVTTTKKKPSTPVPIQSRVWTRKPANMKN